MTPRKITRTKGHPITALASDVEVQEAVGGTENDTGSVFGGDTFPIFSDADRHGLSRL